MKKLIAQASVSLMIIMSLVFGSLLTAASAAPATVVEVTSSRTVLACWPDGHRPGPMPRVKPRKCDTVYNLSSQTGLRLKKMSWQKWTAKVAKGKGTVTHNGRKLKNRRIKLIRVKTSSYYFDSKTRSNFTKLKIKRKNN